MNQELYDQLLNGGLVALYREKRKKDILEVNNRVRAEEVELNKKKQLIDEKPYEYSSKKGWGIFFLILCVMGNISLFSSLGTLLENGKLVVWLLSGSWTFLLTSIGLILLVFAKKTRKKYIIEKTAEYKAEEEKYTDLLKKSTEELNGITAEINEFNANHGHFLDFLPEKYRSIEAIGFMLEAVYNLRADTLKEVINLYEAELRDRNIARMQHLQNERMLYAVSQINDNQERINSTLQEIKTLQFVDIMTN